MNNLITHLKEYHTTAQLKKLASGKLIPPYQTLQSAHIWHNLFTDDITIILSRYSKEYIRFCDGDKMKTTRLKFALKICANKILTKEQGNGNRI